MVTTATQQHDHGALHHAGGGVKLLADHVGEYAGERAWIRMDALRPK
jgi:hypothetical protein